MCKFLVYIGNKYQVSQMQRIMLKSKIHRATITDANLDYEGSPTIDPILMERADILPYEKVDVVNINNGSSCHGVLLAEEPITEFDTKEERSFEENNESSFDARDNAKKYYSQEIQQSTDLKTSACCNIDDIPEYVRKTLPLINDEIKMKYYGCGTCFPEDIESLKILDVGCGTGRDVYIMSKLVGPDGFVYGLDMTSEQIELGQRYIKDQAKRFGYNKTNVKFIHDYMENISEQIESNSLDLVTSNCVINLAENKEDIIRQIYEVLKEGGELYFSDVYADRRLPDNLKTHPVIHGECLGGGLFILRILNELPGELDLMISGLCQKN